MAESPVFWLVNLARAEERLARAREGRRAAARRGDDLAGLAAECAAEAADLRGRQTAALRAARALETRLREREALVARLQGRERELRSTRESEALAREIAAARAELAALEDEGLRRLEEAEALGREALAREGEAGARREQAAAQAAVAAAAQERADRLEASLADEVRTCERQLPPQIAAEVARLRRAVEPPVAPLTAGACGGCGAAPPPQVAIEIERGRVPVRCEACGRFLVAPA